MISQELEELIEDCYEEFNNYGDFDDNDFSKLSCIVNTKAVLIKYLKATMTKEQKILMDLVSDTNLKLINAEEMAYYKQGFKTAIKLHR